MDINRSRLHPPHPSRIRSRGIEAGALIATALALSAIAAVPAAAAAETRTISVSGDSSIALKSNVASFAVSVRAQDSDQATALRRTSKRTRRVIRALRAAEVKRDDVETLGVSVRQRVIRSGKGEKRIRRYIATNRLRVTTAKVGSVGGLIDTAIDAGAGAVGRLTFSRSDARERYRDQLAAAFDDARAKAERLAAEAGLALGLPLSIEESSFRRSVEPNEFGALDSGGEAARTPVRPGKTKIRVRTYVVFEAS